MRNVEMTQNSRVRPGALDYCSTKACFAYFEFSSEEPTPDKFKTWFFLWPGPLDQRTPIRFSNAAEPFWLFRIRSIIH